MTLYFKTYIYTAQNGKVLRVTHYREKYAPRDFWRVDYEYFVNGLGYARNLRDGLLNKPNKRQIARYLETISY